MGVHSVSPVSMAGELEPARPGGMDSRLGLGAESPRSPLDLCITQGRDRPCEEDDRSPGSVEEPDAELERTGGDFRQDLAPLSDPDAFLIGTGGVPARDHQVDAVGRLVSLVRIDHRTSVRPVNYLVQHATGSGKSLTMAALAVSLLKMRLPEEGRDRPFFSMVIFLTDRRNLDKQLGDTVESFLGRHGLSLLRASTSAELAEALSSKAEDRPKAVLSTLQKFPNLQSDSSALGAIGRVLRDGKVAIIVDEAHRGHGHTTSASINQILGGRTAQPPGVVYFGFTATPSPQSLTLFGVRRTREEGKVEYVPAHTYSMADALRDGRVMNPLQHYTCVTISLEVGKEGGGAKSMSLKAMQHLSGRNLDFASYCRLLDLAGHDAAVLSSKAKFIADHFTSCLTSRTCACDGSDFRPRAMVVCKSRSHVASFTCALREVGVGLSVYGAFSGDVNIDGADGTTTAWSEASLNAGFASLNDADILVVCNKLETGFNEPRLAIMYIDRKLHGARCVQVLSRINRTAPGKASTRVVDFVNTAQAIRGSFEHFWGECVMGGGSAGAEARAVVDLDACVGRLLALAGGSLAGLNAEEAADVLSAACEGADGRRDLAADLAQCVLLCQQLNLQKYELPLSFAMQLHKAVGSKKFDTSERSAAASSDILSALKVGVAGMHEVHSGEIRVSVQRSNVSSAKELGFVPLSRRDDQSAQSARLTLRDHARVSLNTLGKQEILHHVQALHGGLKAALAAGDDALAVFLLQKLEMVNVTLELLKETGVGVTVKKAAKHSRKNVSELASSIVRAWKKLLSETAPLPLPQALVAYPEAQHLHESGPREALIVKIMESLLVGGCKGDGEGEGAAKQGGSPRKRARPDSDGDLLSNANAVEIAREIELQIAVHSVQGRGGKAWYNGKARQLLYNLRDAGNDELRDRVLGKTLSASQLVQADASQIANQKVKRQREQLKEEVLLEVAGQMESGKSLLAPNSQDFVCSGCGSRECHVKIGTTGGWISSEKVDKKSITCCACGKEFAEGEDS